MQDVKLIKIETDEQVKNCAAIADEIWHEWFPSILSAEQIDYMVEKFQSESAMKEQMSEKGYQYYYIHRNGVHMGYTAIQPQEDGRLFLSKIYLKKEYRGKGYANAVFSFLKEYCRKNSLKAIWLTVNKHNESSMAVYEKKGFRVIGEDVTDIGNGYVMDDYFYQLDVE
ncbi:MAG: GNAT family N-acetyltransferase [Oscillospiraceae bacterium]|nr:GNAT family N-acetyltransferase [Oscillospiraceae bacterium]